MDIETGRITRSRAKMSMGSTTPLSRPSKKVETLLRKSRNLKKQLRMSAEEMQGDERLAFLKDQQSGKTRSVEVVGELTHPLSPILPNRSFSAVEKYKRFSENSSSQPSSALKSTETSSPVDLQEVSGNQRELQYVCSAGPYEMPLPLPKQPTINENASTNPDVCTMSTTETSGQCASRIPLKDVSNISVVGQVPVSSSHPSLQKIHEELYNEVTAMFAPERLTFDVEQMANAVIVKDWKTFSKTVRLFCSLNKDDDSDGAIHSLISKWRDEYGGSLIHLLCRNMKCSKTHECDDLIRALVRWNPELLRVQDILLKIPLHLAVEKGQAKPLLQGCRVTTLLELESPIGWLDCNNRSPLDIAYKYGNGTVLKLLLNSGATFHELMANDEERSTSLKAGVALEILMRHHRHLSEMMRDTRKKILRNFLEIAVLSPVFIAPLKDGVMPTFQFTYNPSPYKSLGIQNPILFTYLAVNRLPVGKKVVEWAFRCYGPLYCFAPILNGRLLEPMTGRAQLGVQTSELLTDTFVFFCPLQNGVNVLTFKLHEEYANTRTMFAAQVVMVGNNYLQPY